MRGLHTPIFYALVLTVLPAAATAQFFGRLLHVANDTGYVSMHDADLTVRPYVARSFNQYSIRDARRGEALRFAPNAPLTAGVGFSYRIIGFNIGVAAPWVNSNNRYGKTEFTDLSSHFYLRRYTVDVYYQKYRGQYLSSPALTAAAGTTPGRQLAPDLSTSVTGIGVQYLVNPNRYSMEAPFAFVQYQRKSAGSPILGINLSRSLATADSGTIISEGLADAGFLRGYRFNRSETYSAALDAGYAYTLVLRKHFYLSGAVNGGIGLQHSALRGGGTSEFDNRDGYGLQLSTIFRAGFGYNSELNFIGIQYVGYIASNRGPLAGLRQNYSISRVNFTVARRFPLKKKLLWVY